MNRKRYILIAVMCLSTLCYTYPYLSSTFYTQFMEAFELTNEQIGTLLSMFGLTDGSWDFLEPHAYAVMRRIQNPEIAALHIMEV